MEYAYTECLLYTIKGHLRVINGVRSKDRNKVEFIISKKIPDIVGRCFSEIKAIVVNELFWVNWCSFFLDIFRAGTQYKVSFTNFFKD